MAFITLWLLALPLSLYNSTCMVVTNVYHYIYYDDVIFQGSCLVFILAYIATHA